MRGMRKGNRRTGTFHVFDSRKCSLEHALVNSESVRGYICCINGVHLAEKYKPRVQSVIAKF